MRKALLVSTILLLLSLLFVSCATKGIDYGLVLDNSSPFSIREGGTYGPNSVLELAWKGLEGREIIADVSVMLNNVKIKEFFGVTKLTFTVEEEGSYVAIITAKGARGNTKAVNFSVNRLWAESLSSFNGSSDGLFYFDTCSSLLRSWVLNGHSPFIAFYGLEQNVIANVVPETENVRTRLTLVDTDDDGVYDAWQEVATYAQQKIPLPVREDPTYGLLVPHQLIYTTDRIEIWQWLILTGQYAGYLLNTAQPTLFASVGFELNWPYTRRLDTYEEESNYAYGQIIKLHALYDSDKVPMFSLDVALGNPARDIAFTAVITAENVARFGQIYNTRYMQIPVFFSTNIAFRGITFDNFMPGLSDISSYRVIYDVINDEGEDCNILMIYRGFLEGADEPVATTPVFASIDFETLDDEPGFIALDYIDEYGADVMPVFKDNQNKNVDGFVIDYDTWIPVNGI